MRTDYDIIVVGGGFFGCCLALFLRSVADHVLVLERSDALMTRASAINQARVHAGFHYPRSFLTAARSLANRERFRTIFPNAVIDNFEMLYAIARCRSKITAKRFAVMYRDMGAPIYPAGPQHKALFNSKLIEDVFICREYAFDWTVLRRGIVDRLERAGVEVRFDADVDRLEPRDASVQVILKNGGQHGAKQVLNATYAQINALPIASGMVPFATKYELAEIALVEPPPEMFNMAVTVMDGPFFSLVPYPAEGLFSLTHVRYTPHYAWVDETAAARAYDMASALPKRTRWRHMVADARRYMPCMDQIVWQRSAFEVKTVLQRNESDDGRPILFGRHKECPNLISVLGGKIDNVFDLFEVAATEEPRWRSADVRFLL